MGALDHYASMSSQHKNPNINQIQQTKRAKQEHCRDKINMIYEKLRIKKGLGTEMMDLGQIQNHLPKKLKDIFIKTNNHAQILMDMNILNNAFCDILEQVCCYKLELGLTTQKMIESYNILMLM